MTRNYAAELTGLGLVDGWTVIQRLEMTPDQTGGHFSVGYIVANASGARAFCKALDFTAAFREPDPARALGPMVDSYNFERDLLEKCAERKMDRIVRVLASGSVTVDPTTAFSVVQYLIFELAQGDIRKHMRIASELDVAWALRCMHNIAIGISQLHRAEVVHQDLKPSNIMVFTMQLSKVADLGRASDRARPVSHDELNCAGALAYAPPELLYGQIPAEWGERRVACDLYHLGSLLLFLMVGVSATPALIAKLPLPLRPGSWRGSYADLLPYVRTAFGEVVEDFQAHIPAELTPELTPALRQLCDPEPQLRGHPSNRVGNRDRYALEQYVSMFNRLAGKSEARARLRHSA